MKKILLILFFHLIFCKPTVNENDYHVSLVIHEDLINEFFKNTGDIKGEGDTPIASYSWQIIQPYVEIENDAIFLYSKVKVQVGDVKTIKNINGFLSAYIDEEINKIMLKIEEAKLIIDVNVFGSEYILAELDLADYFPDIFKLNGPNVNKSIDFKLPNGKLRIVDAQISESFLKLNKDKIEVYSKVEFTPQD